MPFVCFHWLDLWFCFASFYFYFKIIFWFCCICQEKNCPFFTQIARKCTDMQLRSIKSLDGFLSHRRLSDKTQSNFSFVFPFSTNDKEWRKARKKDTKQINITHAQLEYLIMTFSLQHFQSHVSSDSRLQFIRHLLFSMDKIVSRCNAPNHKTVEEKLHVNKFDRILSC